MEENKGAPFNKAEAEYVYVPVSSGEEIQPRPEELFNWVSYVLNKWVCFKLLITICFLDCLLHRKH